MIKAFIFENFKGFEKAELYLEDTTILIGANASGKSNALEGIAILAELARGRNIVDILDGTRNSEGIVRGGSKGCCHQGSDSFTLGCVLKYNEKWDIFHYRTICTVPTLYIAHNRYFVFDPDNVSVEDIICGKNVCELKISDRYDFLDRLVGFSWTQVCSNSEEKCKADISFNDTKQMNKFCQDILAKIFVFSPNPKEMGSYSRVSDPELRSDCSNLSSALFALCKDEKKKAALLDMIRQLPENAIENIGFLELPNGDVLFYLVEKQGDRTVNIYANQLSDGTLRSLAIAAAMLGEPEGSTIVIDEVDTGIHPSRAKFLIEWLHQTGIERKIDVIVTTHNVSLLNSLENETVMGVSVAYRDKNEGGSKIVSFVDLEDASLILANGGIGTAAEKEKLLSSMEPKKPFEMPEWLVNKE